MYNKIFILFFYIFSQSVLLDVDLAEAETGKVQIEAVSAWQLGSQVMGVLGRAFSVGSTRES